MTFFSVEKELSESEWCMFQFKFAHIETLKDHVNRIIIIKMGDLPKDEDLPLRYPGVSEEHHQLTRGQVHFWDTLLYALPRS
ncbi:hypothetical protein CEXT_314921 [Caerostris extrusa]|uniref:TIR domain-containing protein n=1 Tax=Caerostris extrusa TaxID=172846 RepID=A0AAV4UNU8_CAEEX|nr:hypothetical protein CEXT_314921 [Caerostris extrusa]